MLGRTTGGKHFFCEKNEGAKTFCEEKNDGVETFFGRDHMHRFFVIDALLCNAKLLAILLALIIVHSHDTLFV